MPNRISRDRALPLDLLADQAVYELELREIWQREWIFAGPADEVAQAGDFVAITIGDQPVILVRGDDLKIRALANVCSHRGAPLVDGPGNGSRFTCPYHGWSYRIDGELQTVPYTLADEIDTAKLCLASYRCETWHGLVFVNLDPDAEPLATRLQAIEPYVRPLAIARLQHDAAGVQDERWRANWKAVFANAVDSYCHFKLHADTIEPFSPTDGAYYLAGSGDSTVTGGESFDRADYLVVAIAPSFVAVVHSDSMVWQALAPDRVDRTAVRIGFAAEHSGSGQHENPWQSGWDRRHIAEDREICEALQRNARSRTQPGPLLGLERAVADFHEFLSSRLTGRAAGPPFVAAAPGERPEPA